MNLLALAIGIRGAEHGTAVVNVHNDSTPATVYADSHGTIRRWGVLNLDSRGAIQAYVDELVTVAVYNKAGDLIHTFVDGTTARAVHVDSASFVEPASPLSSVLDGVESAFGGIDFEVLIGATSTRVREALAGVSGVYYNVTALEYGATGDGVTDDALSIQRAITAADIAGGGIVYFPSGTYLISEQIVVPGTVSLLGISANMSTISVTDGAQRALYFSGYGELGPQRLEKLSITATVTHSASLVTTVRGANLTVRDCLFGNSSCTGPLFELQNTNIAGTTDRSMVRVAGTRFVAGGTAEDDASFGRCIASYATSATARLEAYECTFVAPATCGEVAGIVLVLGQCVHLRNCFFDHTAFTSGTIAYDVIPAASGAWGSVIGCRFSDHGGGTVAVNIGAVMVDSADWYCELGNRCESIGVDPSSGAVDTRCRDIVQASTGSGYGYYLKADSTHYYGESNLAGQLTAANQNISTMSFASPAGITAVDLTKANASGYTRILSNRSVQGDSFTYLGYSCGGARIDFVSDSSDAAYNFHSVVPAIDHTVGTGYFAMKFRMMRTYGLPGPTLRTKWYCVGVGGYTKAGFTRKSY